MLFQTPKREAARFVRSAIQLVARAHGAKGKNLKDEIDDLAAKSLILPIMKEWAHEVRELGNEGTHPRPGSPGTDEKGREGCRRVFELPYDSDVQPAASNR